MKNQKIAVFCQSYFNIGKPFSRILYMKMPPCGTIVPHGGAEFPEYFCFSLLFVDFSLWPTPRERSFGRANRIELDKVFTFRYLDKLSRPFPLLGRGCPTDILSRRCSLPGRSKSK